MAKESNVTNRTNANAEHQHESTSTASQTAQQWQETMEQSGAASGWRWLKDHPTATVVGALGFGVVAGRLLMGPSEPPPTFSERAEAMAREMAKEARYRAGEAGEAVSKAFGETAHTASKQFEETTRTAERAGRDLAATINRQKRENPEMMDRLTNAAYTALAALMVKKVNDWVRGK